ACAYPRLASSEPRNERMDSCRLSLLSRRSSRSNRAGDSPLHTRPHDGDRVDKRSALCPPRRGLAIGHGPSRRFEQAIRKPKASWVASSWKGRGSTHADPRYWRGFPLDRLTYSERAFARSPQGWAHREVSGSICTRYTRRAPCRRRLRSTSYPDL